MPDPRIFPTELHIGDVITSDPRRDFPVRTVALDDFGDVVINDHAPDRVRIDREQTVTITPRTAA